MGYEEDKREGFDLFTLESSMESMYLSHMEGKESENVWQSSGIFS